MQVQGECEKTPHRKVPASRWIQTQDHEASLLTTELIIYFPKDMGESY